MASTVLPLTPTEIAYMAITPKGRAGTVRFDTAEGRGRRSFKVDLFLKGILTSKQKKQIINLAKKANFITSTNGAATTVREFKGGYIVVLLKAEGKSLAFTPAFKDYAKAEEVAIKKAKSWECPYIFSETTRLKAMLLKEVSKAIHH